jgi:SMC interacting uncharacterized protein involved in chromosome segregation
MEAAAAEIADLKRQIAEMKSRQARHAAEDMEKKARQARLNVDAKARAEEFETRLKNGEFDAIGDQVLETYMNKKTNTYKDIDEMLTDFALMCNV